MPDDFQSLLQQVVDWWQALYKQADENVPGPSFPAAGANHAAALDLFADLVATNLGMELTVKAVLAFMSESQGNQTAKGLMTMALGIPANHPQLQILIARLCLFYAYAMGRGLLEVPAPPLSAGELEGLEQIRRQQGGGSLSAVFGRPGGRPA